MCPLAGERGCVPAAPADSCSVSRHGPRTDGGRGEVDGLGLQLGVGGSVGPGELSGQGSNQSGSPAQASSLEVGSVWILIAAHEIRDKEDACYSSLETVNSSPGNGLF